MNFRGVRTYGRMFLALAVIAAVGISLTSCGEGGGTGAGAGTGSAIMERSLAASASPLYQGFLSGANYTGIWGWAWDENNPGNTISVDIYDGTTLLATVAANIYGADLALAGIGNGQHVFTYTPSFTNGTTHSINVYYSGTTTPLTGGPKMVAVPMTTSVTTTVVTTSVVTTTAAATSVATTSAATTVATTIAAYPGAPGMVSVASPASGTALVTFTAPASSSTITQYMVTATPAAGGTSITMYGTSSPITLTGLTPKTAYTFSVMARNSGGGWGATATTGVLTFYSIVETFNEPILPLYPAIFTGTFTYDSTNVAVSNLMGYLTEAMQENMMGMSLKGISLTNQLSTIADRGLGGLLVTTFLLPTTNVLDTGGFMPATTTQTYYGLAAGIPNNNNAYAMVFIPTPSPATALTAGQIDMLSYADCTPAGMMTNTCMTGSNVDGWSKNGTMKQTPLSEVITQQ